MGAQTMRVARGSLDPKEASLCLLYTLVSRLLRDDPEGERSWVAVLNRQGADPVIYRGAAEADVRAQVAAHPVVSERNAFAVDRVHDDYFHQRSAPDLLASFDHD